MNKIPHFPLQHGDVFERCGELYYTEAVAPSGTIYAWHYDLVGGPYGSPVSFPSGTSTWWKFNHFTHEAQANAQYCMIHIHLDWADDWCGSEWYEAIIDGVKGNILIGRTNPRQFVRGEPELWQDTPSNRASHQALVDELRQLGWLVVLEHRKSWEQVRLRRALFPPFAFQKRREGEISCYLDVYEAASNQRLYALPLADLPYSGGRSIFTHHALSADRQFLEVRATQRFLGDSEHEETCLYHLETGALLYTCDRLDLLGISLSPDRTQVYLLCENCYKAENGLWYSGSLVIRLDNSELVEERLDDGALYRSGIPFNIPLFLTD